MQPFLITVGRFFLMKKIILKVTVSFSEEKTDAF